MTDDRVRAATESDARWVRWAALFFVLLVEFEVITLGVDGQLVAHARGGSWSQLGSFERFGRTAFLFATTFLVLGRPSRSLGALLAPRVERALLFAHGALFGVFWLLTHVMLGKAEAPRGSPLAWIVAWAVVGAAVGSTLWLGLMGVPRLRARDLGLPVAACFALAWVTSQIGWWTQELWRPFSSAALRLAGLLLSLVSSSVVVDPPNLLLELDGFSVRVESLCSGLEGVGMIAALGVAYLAIFRRELRFPRAWALVAAAIALTWLANGFRLAAMVWLGAHVSPELALGGFHSKAGWVLFSSIALGMAFTGHNARFFARQGANTSSTSFASEPTAGFLMPLLVLLAAALVLGMFGRAEGPGYAARMALGLATLFFFRRHYRDLRWSDPGALSPCLLGGLLGLVWVGSGLLLSRGEPVASSSVSFGWLLLRAIGFSTIVPLSEELAFRGYLLRVLQNRDFSSVPYRAGAWWAVVVSSLAFGALHERWFAGTVAGLSYALIQIRGGRLRDAVLAHAATNATLAAFALATQNPNLFG